MKSIVSLWIKSPFCHPQPPAQWSLRSLSISTFSSHPLSSTETNTPGKQIVSLNSNSSISGSCVWWNPASSPPAEIQRSDGAMSPQSYFRYEPPPVHAWVHTGLQACEIYDMFQPFPTRQVLGSLFYAYYVFVRLCIPQFRSISLQLFDPRAMVLCVFNSILPGEISHPCQHKKKNTPSFLNWTLPKTRWHLQEFWFSSWHSLPSSTAGWMLSLRCSALLTGCFTRYLHRRLQSSYI